MPLLDDEGEEPSTYIRFWGAGFCSKGVNLGMHSRDIPCV